MAREIKQFQKQFDNLLAYWPNEDPDLRKLRSKAFDQFKSLGLPTKQWEEWQFTDFSSLKKINFRLSQSKDLPQIPENISGRIPSSYLIYIVNGHYQKDLSEIPESISISTGIDHFQSNKELYIDNNNLNPFSALNTSMMNSGICIALDSNTVIDKPIQVIYSTIDILNPLMNHPKFIFQLGKNSEAKIIEHYKGSTELAYFINPVSNVILEDNAKLCHFRIEEDDALANHIASTNYILNSDSQLNSVSTSSGSKLFRHNINLAFNNKGGYATINGLSTIKNDQHHDQHIIIDHFHNACQSEQLFKYILSDRSSGVFNGKVVVKENTQHTDADQANKNLLLSSDAIMNTNPQLEIYSEDVKCSHGSTTGQIDSEALFYLQSRGISKSKSIELIINGFAKDIVEQINNEDVKNYINTKVTNWIEEVLIDA